MDGPSPEPEPVIGAEVSARGALRAALQAGAALLPIALLVVGLRASGLLDELEPERLRAVVAELGWLGPIAYVLMYVFGIVAHVPGALFVATGVLAYGPWGGLGLAYLGASSANLACFGLGRLGRRIGRSRMEGIAAREAETGSGRVVRALRASRIWSALSQRPYLAITIVRVVFPTTAAVSAALAFAHVPFRAYVVGSLLGVLPQLATTVALFAWAFS